MTLFQKNRLYYLCLPALLTVLAALLLWCMNGYCSEKQPETSEESILRKAARIEITENTVFIDETREITPRLQEKIVESAVGLEPGTQALLLFWSFPETAQPAVTLCFEETGAASFVQLLESVPQEATTEIRIGSNTQWITVELSSSTSHGQALLSIGNLQLDLHCRVSDWLQHDRETGRVIVADFVTDTAPAPFSIQRHNTTSSHESENPHSLHTRNPGNSSDTASNAPLPGNAQQRDQAEPVTLSSGSSRSQDDQDPRKRPGRPSQPLQIVVLLPAMSHGIAGILNLPGVSFQAFSEPAETLQPVFTGEQNSDEAVVILQVTTPSGAFYQVEIDQENWHRIRQRNLHRNAGFLYNLAARWQSDRHSREEKVSDLLSLIDELEKINQELNSLLEQNAVPEQVDERIVAKDGIHLDIESIWQELSQLMPDRLSALIRQFDQDLVQELFNTLFHALTADLPAEAPETTTIQVNIQVKGIQSYGNGTTSSDTSPTQTPPTNTGASTGSFVSYGARNRYGYGGYGSFGSGGSGRGGGWGQSPPPSYGAAAAPRPQIDLATYLSTNIGDSRSAGYQPSDKELAMLPINVNEFQLALLAWIVAEKPLLSNPQGAGKFKGDIRQSSRFVRGYLYVFVTELGLDYLKTQVDPLGWMKDMSSEEIIWQTTGHQDSLVKEKDAHDVIAKINMIRIARAYNNEHFELLKEFHFKKSKNFRIVEDMSARFSPNCLAKSSCEFAVVNLLVTLLQNHYDHQDMRPANHVTHMIWYLFQTVFLERERLVVHPDTQLLSINPPATRASQSSTALVTVAPQTCSPLSTTCSFPSPLQGGSQVYPRQTHSPRLSFPVTPPQLVQAPGPLPPYASMTRPPPYTPGPGSSRPALDLSGVFPPRQSLGAGRIQSGAPLSLHRPAPVKRPPVTTAAEPPRKKALFEEAGSQASSLQSTYILLTGLIDPQRPARSTQDLQVELKKLLANLSDRDIHQIAFLLGLSLTSPRGTEQSSNQLITSLVELGVQKVLSAMKMFMDREPDHKNQDAKAWSRQVVAIVASQLSVAQTASLITELEALNPDMSRQFRKCTSPLLCTMEWWSRAHGQGAFSVRILSQWLSYIDAPSTASLIQSLIDQRVSELPGYGICTMNQLHLIKSLGASNNMISALAKAAGAAASAFRGTAEEALKKLLVQELALGTLNWEGIRVSLQQTGFTVTERKVKEYLQSSKPFLQTGATVVTAPQDRPRGQDEASLTQTFTQTTGSTSLTTPLSAPSAPPLPKLPAPPGELIARYTGAPGRDVTFGQFVQMPASHGGLFTLRFAHDITFLRAQIGRNSGFQEYDGGYVILPANNEFLQAISSGTSAEKLNLLTEQLVQWLKTLVANHYCMPDIRHLATIRMTRSGREIFTPFMPQDRGWGSLLSPEFTSQLGTLMATMVQRATGVDWPSPGITYQREPAATYYRRYTEAVPKSYRNLVRAARELNGQSSAIPLNELENILVKYSLIELPSGQDEAAGQLSMESDTESSVGSPVFDQGSDSDEFVSASEGDTKKDSGQSGRERRRAVKGKRKE